MCIRTGCALFWNICGSEVIDEIGMIFSVTGVGDLCGTDFGRSCSGVFTFEGREVGGGREDGCFSIGFSSWGGGRGDDDRLLSTGLFSEDGGGDGSFWTVSCGSDSDLGWSLTEELTRSCDDCFSGGCCSTGDGWFCGVGVGC